MLWPLEVQSTEFDSELMYLHWDTLEVCSIAAILLATNVRNLLFSLARYLSTTVLSVQNTDSFSGNCSSLFNIWSIRTAKVAAVNSECEIVVGFSGTTLAFPKAKAQ